MVPPSFSSDRDRLSSDFWEGRYQADTPPWDLGQPAPPLVRLFTSPDAPAPGKTVVLGSGSGHDAVFLAQQEFAVTGVDFAPSAIAQASRLAANAKVSAQFLQRDIFDLLPEYEQQFDYVVEHTCFCALEPNLRDRYVQLVHQLLKPDGHYIGLFFTHNRPGGPPFGSRPEELQQLFSRHFVVLSLEPVPDSISDRSGEEHLGRLQKR